MIKITDFLIISYFILLGITKYARVCKNSFTVMSIGNSFLVLLFTRGRVHLCTQGWGFP